MNIIEYITGGCLMLGALLLLLAILGAALCMFVCLFTDRPRRYIKRIEWALAGLLLSGAGASSFGALFALLAVFN